MFVRTLREDQDLYRVYKDNLAMAYYDCANWEKSRDSSAKKRAIGNRAANYFLQLLLSPVSKDKRMSGKNPTSTQKKLTKL